MTCIGDLIIFIRKTNTSYVIISGRICNILFFVRGGRCSNNVFFFRTTTHTDPARIILYIVAHFQRFTPRRVCLKTVRETLLRLRFRKTEFRILVYIIFLIINIVRLGVASSAHYQYRADVSANGICVFSCERMRTVF